MTLAKKQIRTPMELLMISQIKTMNSSVDKDDTGWEVDKEASDGVVDDYSDEDSELWVGVDKDDNGWEADKEDADGVDDEALLWHVGVVGQAEQSLLSQTCKTRQYVNIKMWPSRFIRLLQEWFNMWLIVFT